MRTKRPVRPLATALFLGLLLGVLGLGAVSGTAAAQSSEPAPPPASSSAAPTAPATEPAPEKAPEQAEDTRRGEIWIPDWILLIPAVAVIIAAVTMATKSYLRFTQTRHDLEG
ncbi:MAG: hypothetical protein ACTH0P_09765 [Candidatus Corynebacterium faecigallinarum]|uniref:hypothetical protein n=1 Tax=Candidatus Corynebacterium faecigallinarum TaxID=2838528 RepID=UPI003FB85DCB